MWWIYLLLGLVIGLAVGVLGVVLWYRKGFSETREGLIEQEKESVQEAERRLSEALKTGERRKQELLLEAKEEIQRSKTSLEQTVQARRQEHNKERDRLEQKEEQLDRKQQSLEDQLANVAEKQAEVDRKLEETDRLLEERSYALERISELSMEEARKQVLDHAEKTFRHEQAQMLRQGMNICIMMRMISAISTSAISCTLSVKDWSLSMTWQMVLRGLRSAS